MATLTSPLPFNISADMPLPTTSFFVLALPFFLATVSAQYEYTTANLSTLWTNNASLPPDNFTYSDGSAIRAVLLSKHSPSFALGFYCKDACDAFLLAIFIVYTNSQGIPFTNLSINAIPQVVWSANRDRPVRENATLHFSQDGDLLLRDSDGTLVWSTNTSAQSVVGMSLTDNGNLVLVDRDNASIWASFDHPTDSLVLGQTLREGQRLTANVSPTNWPRGQFYLTVKSNGLHAYVDASPPQLYYDWIQIGKKTGNKPAYVTFTNGSLQLFALFTQPGQPDASLSLPQPSSVQYMRLEPDGHLRLYEWQTQWTLIGDVFSNLLDDCAYPTVCGNYGICSNGQCSCLGGSNCLWKLRHLLEVQIPQTSPTPSPTFNGSQRSPSPSGKSAIAAILGPALGFLLGVFLFIGVIFVLLRRKEAREMEEEDHVDQVPGMPTRFSFAELKVATDDFCRKLGGGGFGSVFEGKLGDGTRVAVKRLDGIGQGKREFLAEVETIGSINHINLVRLIGFCAEKSHRLLVYEYMCNGSLDKWIFYNMQNNVLDWHMRIKIITDVAKGLSYLHEGCRQTIAHLDIKPHNILLDDKLDAKVSDFGLAKLIDRDKSNVMTHMRGTPGYLAPEWLSSIITEKVDIYSFGVVVMEIVCGRKNLDYSQPEENFHLIRLLQDKSEIDQLLDLVDPRINLELYEKEVIEMMELAMWCLQSDSNKRPSMSTVVRVLEGGTSVETNLDRNFATPATLVLCNADNLNASTPLLASILSGPR